MKTQHEEASLPRGGRETHRNKACSLGHLYVDWKARSQHRIPGFFCSRRIIPSLNVWDLGKCTLGR